MDGKNSLIFQPVLQILRLPIRYFLTEDQFTNTVWLQKKKKKILKKSIFYKD